MGDVSRRKSPIKPSAIPWRKRGSRLGFFPPEMLQLSWQTSTEDEIWPLEFHSIQPKPKRDHFVVGLVSVGSEIKLSIHPAALPDTILQPSHQLVRWRPSCIVAFYACTFKGALCPSPIWDAGKRRPNQTPGNPLLWEWAFKHCMLSWQVSYSYVF